MLVRYSISSPRTSTSFGPVDGNCEILSPANDTQPLARSSFITLLMNPNPSRRRFSNSAHWNIWILHAYSSHKYSTSRWISCISCWSRRYVFIFPQFPVVWRSVYYWLGQRRPLTEGVLNAQVAHAITHTCAHGFLPSVCAWAVCQTRNTHRVRYKLNVMNGHRWICVHDPISKLEVLSHE